MRKCPRHELDCGAIEDAVLVGRIIVVAGLNERLVGAIDSAAVPQQYLADVRSASKLADPFPLVDHSPASHVGTTLSRAHTRESTSLLTPDGGRMVPCLGQLNRGESVKDYIEAVHIGDLLARAAAHQPQRDAIVFPNERRTYNELLDGAMQTARGLYALGVRPGEHVGILMPNGIETVEAFFATSLIGAVAVPINARYKVAELRYVVEDADLVTILTTDLVADFVDFAGLLAASLPSLSGSTHPLNLSLPEVPRLRNAVMLRGSAGGGFVGRAQLDQLAATVDPVVIDDCRHGADIRDVAMVLYTSGTTAHPKGCMLSHEALVRTSIVKVTDHLDPLAHRRVWCPCPLFHVGAIAALLSAVAFCDTYITTTHFEAGEALALMEREAATTAWPLFSAFHQGLLNHPDFAKTDLSSLTQIAAVGTPDELRRLQSAIPNARVMAAYGMTETSAIITLPALNEAEDRRIMCCGQPLRGIELAICDPATGEHVPPGMMGEIVVRGYCLLDGYYRAPEKTAESFDSEGWFHTGDLGLVDAQGRVAFRGRLKDMLKVGGENVAAVEIEAFLSSHPAVGHTEVVGAPDSVLDEIPVAFIERVPGEQITAAELIEFCQGQIARFKIPRHVRFVEPGAWPMSATKVNKVALRERIRNELLDGET